MRKDEGFSMVRLTVRRDDRGVLRCQPSGDVEAYRVVPVRLFPLTSPDHQIAFFRIGDDGTPKEEITVLSDYSEVDDTSRALIEEELDKTSALKIIRRIRSVRQIDKRTRWQVEIREERVTFEVADLKDILEIHAHPLRIVLIKDTAGNRYRIDISNLDDRSRMLLEAYT